MFVSFSVRLVAHVSHTGQKSHIQSAFIEHVLIACHSQPVLQLISAVKSMTGPSVNGQHYDFHSKIHSNLAVTCWSPECVEFHQLNLQSFNLIAGAALEP